MGLILKTKITEQQTQDSATAAATAAQFSAVAEKIAEEKAARETADTQLQNAIATEKNQREAADTLLQNNLNNETSARISADSRLQQNIDSVSGTADANFTALSNSLADETSARINKDSELENNLNLEVTARTLADNNLQDNLSTEIADRKSADTALDTKIGKEITDRANADSALQKSISDNVQTLNDAINTEKQNRENADSALNTALDTESADRKSADTSLTAKIEKEVADRTNALNDMQAALMVSLGDVQALQDIENENLKKQIQEQAQSQSASLSTLSTKLNAEIEDRKNADSSLSTFVQNESTERFNADSDIRADLNTEIQRLTYALSNEQLTRERTVDAVKASLNSETKKLSASISNEVTARTDAIANLRADLNSETQKLSTAISDEATNRTKAISDMQAALMVSLGDNKALQDIENEKLRAQIQSQTSLSSASIAGLQTQLQTEAETRSNEDSKLNAAIQAEATARTNAVNDLQSSLTTSIDSKVSTAIANEVTARDKAISDAKSSLTTSINSKATETLNNAKTYADSKFNAVADSLSDFTAPTATANGVHGLVPAPPKGTTIQYLTTLGWKTLDDESVQIANTPTPAGTLTYSGSSQSPTWTNYDSNKMTIGGTTSGTSATSYTATFTPKGVYIWADTKNQETRNVTWSIQPKYLSKPTAAVTAFTYNGANKTLTVTNYNSTYMTQGGTVTASAANSYSAEYTLKNTTNTKWEDSSTSKVTISWKIDPLYLSKPTAAKTSFDYDGETKTLTISNYNSTYMTQSGTTQASAVGSYSVDYTLKSTTNTKWADSTTTKVSISWSIINAKLSAALSTFSFTGDLTYTRPAITVNQNYGQTFDFRKYISGFNETYHTATNYEQYAAGSYEVSIIPNGNYTWSDGTTAAKKVTCTIKKRYLTKPTAATTTLNYDGNDKTLEVVNYDPYYVTQGGTVTASAVGDYKVTYGLKGGANNTAWADSSTANITINWKIEFPRLTEAQSTFKFTTSDLMYSCKLFGGVMEHDLRSYIKGFDEQYHDAANYLQSNAGSYDIPITPKENYCWSDGTTAAKIVTCTIKPRPISLPNPTTTFFTYDGTQKTLSYTGTISYYAKHATEAVNKATNVGSYTDVWQLKDTSNTYWKDDTITNKSVSWQIVPAELDAPIPSATYFAQDGTTKTVTFDGYDSATMTQSGTTQASEVGTYSVTFGLKDSTNYKWAGTTETTITVTWEIGGANVPVPTIKSLTPKWGTIDSNSDSPYHGYYFSSSCVYCRIELTNFNNDLMSGEVVYPGSYYLSDPTYGYNADTARVFKAGGTATIYYQTRVTSRSFSIKLSLKDKTNYKWADGTTTDKTINFTAPNFVISPTLTNATPQSLTYNGAARYWNGFFTANYFGRFCALFKETYDNNADLLRNATGTNAGSYSFTLTPITGVVWNDGTSKAKTYTVTIDKAEPTITVTDSDGNTWTPRTDGDSMGNFHCYRKNPSVTLTVNTDSDGEIKITNNKAAHFTTAIDQAAKTVTVTAVNGAAPDAQGNCGSIVTIKLKEGTNFYAYDETGFYFGFLNFTNIDTISWKNIAQAARDGNVDIGEMKTIKLTGTYGGVDISGDYKALLLGVDHNQAVEGTGAHFAIVKNFVSSMASDQYITPIQPESSKFGTAASSNADAFTHDFNLATYNATLAKDTGFINNIADSSLKSLIKVQKKYTNTTAETTRFFWLSYVEICGVTDYFTKYGGNATYQMQYDFMKNGNKFNRLTFNDKNKTWLRDKTTVDGSTYYWVKFDEGYSYGNANPLTIFNIIPCFVVP